MRRSLLLPLLAALTLAAAIASLLFGPVDLSLARLAAAASGHGDPVAATILFELRLPRSDRIGNFTHHRADGACAAIAGNHKR